MPGKPLCYGMITHRCWIIHGPFTNFSFVFAILGLERGENGESDGESDDNTRCGDGLVLTGGISGFVGKWIFAGRPDCRVPFDRGSDLHH